MNTPTHLLFALAVLARKKTCRKPGRSFWRVLPDLAVFLWAPWQHWVKGENWARIWDSLYFEPSMQLLIAPFNSIPLLALLSFSGFALRAKLWARCMMLIGLAGLLHIALDLPFHNHDAYRHFWPLSDWRFHSPISYWETGHHAAWVSLLEAGLGLICIGVLWRQFPKLWVKIILSVLIALYTAMLLLFWLPVGATSG